MIFLTDRIAACIAEEDGGLALAESILSAHQDRQRETPIKVTCDQTHRSGLAGEETACERIRCEGNLLGSNEHSCPSIGMHLVAAIQGLGCRSNRHPGEGSDIAQGGAWCALVGETHSTLLRFGVVDITRIDL